jgi:hypothetical protein
LVATAYQTTNHRTIVIHHIVMTDTGTSITITHIAIMATTITHIPLVTITTYFHLQITAGAETSSTTTATQITTAPRTPHIIIIAITTIHRVGTTFSRTIIAVMETPTTPVQTIFFRITITTHPTAIILSAETITVRTHPIIFSAIITTAPTTQDRPATFSAIAIIIITLHPAETIFSTKIITPQVTIFLATIIHQTTTPEIPSQKITTQAQETTFLTITTVQAETTAIIFFLITETEIIYSQATIIMAEIICSIMEMVNLITFLTETTTIQTIMVAVTTITCLGII